MSILNAAHLQHFIEAQGITAQILHLEVDTPTVADAAVSLNVAPKQIIKSVLFLADGQPVTVVASGLEGDKEKYLAQGLDDCVSKPVRVQELTAALIRCHLAPVEKP